MATAHGQRLRLRLFLEGVEVPVISANVQGAPNSPVICSIQVPPLPEGTRLLPRTVVHLFFLDDYEAKLPFLSANTTRGANGVHSPTQHQRDEDRFNNLTNRLAAGEDVDDEQASLPAGSTILHYKLLFGGEVVGFVWNKNQAQRSLVLQCADWSNYWDYAYQYRNTGIFGPGRKVLFSGGATNLFTDFLESNGSVITRIVSEGKCNSFPELGGLAAGIIRLMEAIGGIYYPNPRLKGQKRIAGQNVFFSLAELRLHITHMVAAFEKDPTSRKLLRRNGWRRLFNRRLGGLGGQVSIRKAITALTGVIFHETYGQPCPHYKPGITGPTGTKKRVKLTGSPQFNYLASGGEQLASAADDVVTSLRNAVIDDATEEGITGGLTSFKATMVVRLQTIRKFVNRLVARPETRKAPPQARQLLSRSSRLLSSAVSAMANWRPNAPVSVRDKVTVPLGEVAQNLRQLAELTVDAPTSVVNQPARLNQHILRPDIWFGAPPRCNVLFPENYDALSYQRMFLQEPTRLLLKTNDEFFGEDFLFDKIYFSPQTGTVKRDQARMRDMMRGDLLDHELFTGILPVFEKSGEFNVFAAKRGFTQFSDRPPHKEGYAQRSANFLYFKYRFNARQMRVSGKFNPYVACGFPGLIIDKYVDATTIALHNELKNDINKRRNEQSQIPLQEISKALGTNFLGNFTEVTHSVSQQGPSGQTSINCSYPRQPEETVEFLGKEDAATTIRRKVDKGSIRATDMASLNAPKLQSLGPNAGRIVNVVDVTSTYDSERFFGAGFGAPGSGSEARKLPLFTARSRTQGRVQPVFVPVGVQTTARELNSPDVEAITGDLDRPIVFRAFRIEEEIPRFRRESLDVPMEELIHPGWYGDVWKTPMIGKVYEDFFGIGSITDPQVVTDNLPGTQRTDPEAAAQAAEEAALADSPDDPRKDALGFLSLDENSSIQDAVDFLVLTYSYIRQQGLNVDEFIKAYNWRPIATMVDMFGTTDLTFSDNGEQVLRGIEGFHSRAFGPYDNLFGLASPEIKTILGIERTSVAAQKGDTRKRKQEAVQRYVAALLFSRGILG